MTDFPPPPPGFGAGVPEPAEPRGTGAMAHELSSAGAYATPEHGFYQPLAAIAVCLRKYATFRGRASRSEFWWFYLFTSMCLGLAQSVDTTLGWSQQVTSAAGTSTTTNGPIQTVVALAVFLPLISAFCRRMHDVGRSGGYFFWVFTGIGLVWVLVRLCQSGGLNVDNRYGVRE